MNAPHVIEREPSVGRALRAPEPSKASARTRSNEQAALLGALYAHAFAIACEAEPRYREFAALMDDHGYADIAALFDCLAEFEAQTALQLAMNSVGIEIPVIDAREHAWLVDDPPAPGAYAFIFRMMTPRLAMDIALRSEVRARAFFETVRDQSRNALVRSLADELAGGEQAHVEWLTDEFAKLPQPFRADDDRPGDPTIEQQR